MTKISMIGGIPQDEYQDRGKEVPKQPYIAYGALTSGQMNLALLREQMRILAGYYPEAKSELQPAIDKLSNALNSGLHGVSFVETGINNASRLANYAIQKAQKNTRPAIGYMSGKMQRIGVMADDYIETTGNGGSSSTSTIPNASSSGSSGKTLIDYANLEDCKKLFTEYINTSSLFNKKKKDRLYAEFQKCLDKESIVHVMNDHLEGTGHHLLYNYASLNAISNYPAIVTKRSQHRQAVESFSDISGIEKSNMEMWLSNGIMRNNALKGAPPLQPEETIITWRDYVKVHGQEGLGIAPAVVAAIISAVAASIAAVGQLISQISAAAQARVLAANSAIRTEAWGPELEDLLANMNNTSTPNWLLPAGLAVGAGLIFLGSRD